MMVFLYPELLLVLVGIVALLWDAVGTMRRFGAVMLGVSALAGAGVWVLYTPSGVAFGMVVVDPLAKFLKILLMGSVGAILLLSSGYGKFNKERGFSWGTFVGLILLATVGLSLLVSATDFLLAVVAVELVSLSSFVLVGFPKGDRAACESAIKYFLFGGLATGFMIYGVSLLYGATGSTGFACLLGRAKDFSSFPLMVSLFFVMAGFGFKLALVPFHMWAPDVYEGAPTPITAFLSVAPKAAVFGVMARALRDHGVLQLTPLLSVIAALSMTIGNLGALRQTNVKRLLAYSSIAQMGYVMIGFASSGAAGFQASIVYITAYLLMNLGAFAVVLFVEEESGFATLDGFDGLASRSLPLALGTLVFLLSLTGIPPFVGFVGKFSLFGSALHTPGLVWLAVVGAVNSVVSFFYYFSIVRRMFFLGTDRRDHPGLSAPVTIVLGVTVVATLLFGLFPEPLFQAMLKVWP